MSEVTERNEPEESVEIDNPIVKHETLAEAFVYAQREFMPIVHNCLVDFTPQGKRRVRYTYADLAQTQKAVYPALNKHGLSISYDVKDADGRISLVVIMSHAFSEDVKECCLRMAGAEETKDLAAEITYLKRYLLGLITGTASEEDTLDQEQDDAGASEGNQQPERDKAQQGQQAKPEQPNGDSQKDSNLAISVRILGNEIGIEDVKVFLDLETSKSLTQDEWSDLKKHFTKYKASAVWFAGQISKDLSEIAEFAAHRAGDWGMLYPDIKKAKDALDKGNDEGPRDELWVEFTRWTKSQDEGTKPAEDDPDLAEAKADYYDLIDGRKGWKTPEERKVEEAKLSDKPYVEWGMTEHLNAITALKAENAL